MNTFSMWRNYWIDLFILLLGCVSPGFAADFSFQYGVDGYEGAGEAGIHSGAPDISFGESLTLFDNHIRLLFKFNTVNVPAGDYDLKLNLQVSSVTVSGTVSVYILKETRWEDPGMTLNPPSIDQNYPTWNYWNYNIDAWEAPGADGATEKGKLVGQQFISSAAEVIYENQITIEPNQTHIGFLVYGPGRIYFYCKENNEGIVERNPKLTLIGEENRLGGLGWNRFFYPIQWMR